jgi:hypothetical protein
MFILRLFSFGVYRVEGAGLSQKQPNVGYIENMPKNAPQGQISQENRVYTQSEIDEMTQNTLHPLILRKLIKCESQNTNVARIDSNGIMSYGILQFNGSATWNTFAPLAGVTNSAMNPIAAIKVSDWMISNHAGGRWTCWHILGMMYMPNGQIFVPTSTSSL